MKFDGELIFCVRCLADCRERCGKMEQVGIANPGHQDSTQYRIMQRVQDGLWQIK